jgi:hypothetical protein
VNSFWKRHLITEAMLHCITKIITLNVDFLPTEFHKLSLVACFIVDNHGAQGNADCLSLTKEPGIEPAWLPAHSTHFIQTLDAAIFSSFKRHCSNLRPS